jgi:hypothetical protein
MGVSEMTSPISTMAATQMTATAKTARNARILTPALLPLGKPPHTGNARAVALVAGFRATGDLDCWRRPPPRGEPETNRCQGGIRASRLRHASQVTFEVRASTHSERAPGHYPSQSQSSGGDDPCRSLSK